MDKTFYAAFAVAGLIAGAASAQTTAFDNQGAADTAVTALEDQITDDADRNLDGFGNEGRKIGSYGSLALRGTSTSNDGSTTSDLGVGLRYGTFDGVNGIDVTLSYSYSATDGTADDNTLLVGLDYRRDLNDRFFAYAKADAAIDRLSTTVGEFSQDVFVGAGLGYRILNDADTQWSLQAGPGYRIAQVVGGADVNEVAASVSSNFYKSLTNTIYLTNDTDVIYSKFATTVNNEFAVNFALSDQLALRSSYTTHFNDQTDASFKDAENAFGISVVYSFN